MVEMIAEVEEQTWDLFAEDGDMMALLHLWSKNKVSRLRSNDEIRSNLFFSSTSLSTRSLQLIYERPSLIRLDRLVCTLPQSSRASLIRRSPADHDLELEIHVARKDDTEMPAFFHPSSLPSEVERTDDQARLDAAFESLVEEDDSLADELEAVDIKVKDAGEDGLSLSELAVRLSFRQTVTT